MSWHFFVAYFEKFRHLISPAGVDSAPDPRSWMANWDYQKKMDILRIVDCSVTLREKPWRERFEKYWKSWNFRDFWWFLRNSGGGRSGCGLEIWTIYTFWIDLDVGNSKCQKYWMVSRTPGTQVRKYDSAPTGVRAGVGLQTVWPAGAEQKSRKSKKRKNATAASV